MDQQKCQNCAAPMIFVTRADGSGAYLCEYCGSRLDVRPTSVSDKVFAFATRLANSMESSKGVVSKPAVSQQKKPLVEKIEEAERAVKALDQRRKRLAEKARKWGF